MTLQVKVTEIDQLLDHLTEVWESLPEVAGEFDTWSLYERSDFVEEWPLESMRLARLDEYAARGALSAAQATRYAALRELIRHHQPLLERLLQR